MNLTKITTSYGMKLNMTFLSIELQSQSRGELVSIMVPLEMGVDARSLAAQLHNFAKKLEKLPE